MQSAPGRTQHRPTRAAVGKLFHMLEALHEPRQVDLVAPEAVKLFRGPIDHNAFPGHDGGRPAALAGETRFLFRRAECCVTRAVARCTAGKQSSSAERGDGADETTFTRAPSEQ